MLRDSATTKGWYCFLFSQSLTKEMYKLEKLRVDSATTKTMGGGDHRRVRLKCRVTEILCCETLRRQKVGIVFCFRRVSQKKCTNWKNSEWTLRRQRLWAAVIIAESA